MKYRVDFTLCSDKSISVLGHYIENTEESNVEVSIVGVKKLDISRLNVAFQSEVGRALVQEGVLIGNSEGYPIYSIFSSPIGTKKKAIKNYNFPVRQRFIDGVGEITPEIEVMAEQLVEALEVAEAKEEAITVDLAKDEQVEVQVDEQVEVQVEEPKVEEPKATETFTCEVCNKTYATKKGLTAHIKSVHGDNN